MDKCFDSVNGSTLRAVDGKALRSAVKINSGHLEFWDEAIRVFESMKFIRDDGKKTKPPSVTHWIDTMRSFKFIWYKLQSYNLIFLLPRHINQDPLECLFGSFRQHAGRNINPDCFHFMTSFKTLLLNNFSSIKSLNFNCEVDNLGPLSNLKTFLKYKHNNISNNIFFPNNFLNNFNNNLKNTSSYSDMCITYIIGYMAKTILNIVTHCPICKIDLIDESLLNPLLNARNYTSKKSLCHPSSKLFNLVKNILNVISNCLKDIIFTSNISKQLILLAEINVDFPCFSCKEHQIKDLIITNTINFYLFTICKNINNILSGKDSRILNNDLYNLAFQYYNKHSRKYKKKNYNSIPILSSSST